MNQWVCPSCGEINEYQDMRDETAMTCQYCRNLRRAKVV
ncbi:hypothetical protein AAA799E16_01356 [Marine Group I thaumarchaeote SCGC AAA799-E16]|uniref:Uncharacterized protein n=2 Tax=Marine Group I TaxID=905826 RepID=A0A087S5I7_9ARCH|nr:hypothetical protein AAA799E16_01356 [Marine Group I thaumarchaeote SCGC AAA799-E16]KFM20991.1 hypothetical protein SCCGRSA3_00039 [Marine Group I thaumarchaeote SCGC RSA3]